MRAPPQQRDRQAHADDEARRPPDEVRRGRSSRAPPTAAITASSSPVPPDPRGRIGSPGLGQERPDGAAHEATVDRRSGSRHRPEVRTGIGRKADASVSHRPMVTAAARRRRSAPCPTPCIASAASRPAARTRPSEPGSPSPCSWSPPRRGFGRDLEDSFDVPGADSAAGPRAARRGRLRAGRASPRSWSSRRATRGDVPRLARRSAALAELQAGAPPCRTCSTPRRDDLARRPGGRHPPPVSGARGAEPRRPRAPEGVRRRAARRTRHCRSRWAATCSSPSRSPRPGSAS